MAVAIQYTAEKLAVFIRVYPGSSAFIRGQYVLLPALH